MLLTSNPLGYNICSMDTAVMESNPIASTEHLAPINKPIIDYIERAKLILTRYKEGILIKDIASEFNVSEVRISQIVKKNEASLAIDREAEKTRRLRRLKIAEKKGSLALAPKDTDQLVRLIEAQRKELEGDSQSSSSITNNIQINGDVKLMQVNDKWSNLRSLLENT